MDEFSHSMPSNLFLVVIPLAGGRQQGGIMTRNRSDLIFGIHFTPGSWKLGGSGSFEFYSPGFFMFFNINLEIIDETNRLVAG